MVSLSIYLCREAKVSFWKSFRSWFIPCFGVSWFLWALQSLWLGSLALDLELDFAFSLFACDLLVLIFKIVELFFSALSFFLADPNCLWDSFLLADLDLYTFLDIGF